MIAEIIYGETMQAIVEPVDDNVIELYMEPPYIVTGSGGGAWGEIFGDMANQTDLSLALTNLAQSSASAQASANSAMGLAASFQIDMPISDGSSPISPGSKTKYTFAFACTINEIIATLGTPATGGVFTIDIKRTATNTSIFLTKLTIDATEKSSRTAAVPYGLAATPLLFSNNEEIEIIVDIVGGVEAGRNCIVTLIGTKNT